MNMLLPPSESGNKAWDRNKNEWVEVTDISFWLIIINSPMFWALIVVGGLWFFS